MAAPKQCDGTECPGGCCPYVGWYCCPDGMYCAATAADCPFVAKKAQIAKMAANKQCDGTECPGGCCPYVGWYCCPDGMYCAATAADCPFVAGLQVILQHIVGGTLAAPVAHHSCRALDDLPGLALLVDLAEARPLAQLHVRVHLDQRDPVLLAESGDELLVHGLVAVLGEDAEQGLPLVQGLCSLPQ